MTVNTANITSGPYAGNDIVDTFDYTFRIEDKTQVTVYETDSLGVQTTLVVDTDYTVAGIGDDAGGQITRVAGALPTGYTWYIRSNYSATQLTAFASQGGFFPDVHEDAFDKLTFLIQQLADGKDRAFKLADSIDVDGVFEVEEDAATRAAKYLVFDASGNLVTSSGTGADAGLRTDLASTDIGSGASLVAVRDAAAQFTATDVEGVLAEIGVEVDTNTANIATNTADIATNTADIATNAIHSSAKQATTSGTDVVLESSLPTGVKRITVMLNGVSATSGVLQIQLGDSGGYETTGYVGLTKRIDSTTIQQVLHSAASGFHLVNNATDLVYGSVILTLIDPSANAWVISGTYSSVTNLSAFYTGGVKSLSSEITSIKLNTTGTFDVGEASIIYEA